MERLCLRSKCIGLLLLAPLLARADIGADLDVSLEEFEAAQQNPGYTHFGRGLLDRGLEGYDRLRDQARDKHGLDWFIAGSYLYQAHDRGDGDQWLNNFELDTLVNWDLVSSERFGKGSLTYMSSFVWEKRNFTGFGSGATTDEVTASLGSLYKISDSDNLDSRVRQLYWTQSSNDDSFQFYVGQIEIPAFIDDNSYANNDRDAFIAESWTKTTRSSVNIFGLGAGFSITPSDRYYVRAGFLDGNSNLENPKWSTFNSGEYIYAAELGFTPTIDGWGKGIYRISPWYADEADLGEQGHGVNISFEQETPWDAGLWLRAGVSEDRRNAFTSFVGGGAVFTNPFGFNRDRIGVALGWGRPDDGDLTDNTYLMETYWRFQLTERLEFTADVQFHMNPAREPGRDVNTLGSLRAMVRL